MNRVNIGIEYHLLMTRKNLNNTDISVATGVSRQAVRNWKHIDEKYLYKIANVYGDERFNLALFCYFFNLPSELLTLLDRYKHDSLSMLIGARNEDTESDSAIEDLMLQLSKSRPSKKTITEDISEIMETGIYLVFYSLKEISEQRIPIEEIIKTGARNYARKNSYT